MPPEDEIRPYCKERMDRNENNIHDLTKQPDGVVVCLYKKLGAKVSIKHALTVLGILVVFIGGSYAYTQDVSKDQAKLATKQEVGKMKEELKKDIKELKEDINKDIDEVKAQMKENKNEILNAIRNNR